MIADRKQTSGWLGLAETGMGKSVLTASMYWISFEGTKMSVNLIVNDCCEQNKKTLNCILLSGKWYVYELYLDKTLKIQKSSTFYKDEK